MREPKRARYSRLPARSVFRGSECDTQHEAVNVPKQSPDERDSRHALRFRQHPTVRKEMLQFEGTKAMSPVRIMQIWQS